MNLPQSFDILTRSVSKGRFSKRTYEPTSILQYSNPQRKQGTVSGEVPSRGPLRGPSPLFIETQGRSRDLLQHSCSRWTTEWSTTLVEAASAPYLSYGDSTPHRYLLDGNLVVVPHDHCPSCWGQWDVKDLHPICPQCGISMGKEVKWLLDHDRCPNCEQTTVSSRSPKCSQCGYAINPDFIHWADGGFFRSQ